MDFFVYGDLMFGDDFVGFDVCFVSVLVGGNFGDFCFMFMYCLFSSNLCGLFGRMGLDFVLLFKVGIFLVM